MARSRNQTQPTPDWRIASDELEETALGVL